MDPQDAVDAVDLVDVSSQQSRIIRDDQRAIDPLLGQQPAQAVRIAQLRAARHVHDLDMRIEDHERTRSGQSE
jgi:hypothetical protein